MSVDRSRAVDGQGRDPLSHCPPNVQRHQRANHRLCSSGWPAAATTYSIPLPNSNAAQNVRCAMTQSGGTTKISAPTTVSAIRPAYVTGYRRTPQRIVGTQRHAHPGRPAGFSLPPIRNSRHDRDLFVDPSLIDGYRSSGTGNPSGSFTAATASSAVPGNRDRRPLRRGGLSVSSVSCVPLMASPPPTRTVQYPLRPSIRRPPMIFAIRRTAAARAAPGNTAETATFGCFVPEFTLDITVVTGCPAGG